MWLLWIALLIFTTVLALSDATVYGSVNDSPEDPGLPASQRTTSSGLRLPSSVPVLDFVDTRSQLGSRENIDEPTMETDVFSQLKHLQLPGGRGHHPFALQNEPKPASDSEMANVRRSLATVLQVLLPYGRLQQRPAGHEHGDDRFGSYGDDMAELPTTGSSLFPGGSHTANFMLHGKLVELGPRQQQHAPVQSPEPEANSAEGGILGAVGQKRAAALRSTVARRSHVMPAATGGGSGEDSSFLPSISVGALTNLGDFFQNLKHNLESLESKNLNTEQVKLLEGQNMISNLRKEFVADYPKPAGSAAFLHAIRNYRPSHRIRALVSTVPELYRGTNYHDPVYMLAGLGK